MVMKISAWSQKFSLKIVKMGHYTPDMFFKSQWQRNAGISGYYVVYRWVMACVFFSILLASMMDVGRPKGDVYHHFKWLIYLTHWGFSICTIQALMGAYLITKAYRKHPEEDAEAMKMSRSLRVYWVLHNCATVGAFSITAIYWVFVFNPAENRLDAINILMHAGNSVLMLTDLIVISHPIRPIDVYWPVSFAILYVTFNLVYYLAGGTDRKGRTYIYKILDWRQPGKTLIIVQFSIVFVLVVHMSVCVFCLLRYKVSELLRRQQANITKNRTEHLQGATNEIPINDLV